MRALRPVAAVLILAATAVAANAQCVTSVTPLWTSQSARERGPVAWTGNRLVVASSEPPSRAIWISTYEELGQALTTPVRVVSSSLRRPVKLLWTGVDLGLFYVGTDQMLMLQRLSPEGVTIGSPVTLPLNRISTGDEIDVAWSAALDAYVIGRTSTAGRLGVFAITTDRDGGMRRDYGFVDFASPDAELRVTATDSGVAGLFYRSANGERITYARVAADRTFAPIHDIWSSGEDFVVGSRANQFIIVKSAPHTEGRTALRWLVIDTSGEVVRPDTLLLTGSGLDVQPLAIVARETEIALTYLDAPHGLSTFPEYRLHRFAPDGTLLSDTLFAAANPVTARASSPYPFVWTGSAYENVVANPRDDRPITYLARFCPLRASIAAPRFARPDDTIELRAVVDGGVPGYTYSWFFSDRRSAVGPTVSLAFRRTGTYIATLTVTDATGTSYVTTYELTVTSGRSRAVRH